MNKKLSKVFALLLAVSMLFTHFVILPIYADPEEPVNEPANEPAEAPEATSEELEEFRCTCEEADRVDGGHAFIRERTCIDYKYDMHTCVTCGGYFVYEVLDYPLGHDWSIEEVAEVPATCTEDGVAAHYLCARCGAKAEKTQDEETGEDNYTIYEDETVLAIPALGHIPGEPVEDIIEEVSCTEDGSYDLVVYCTREGCGAELSRETGFVEEALGHDWELVGTEPANPTCTDDYTKFYECTRCEAEYQEYIEAGMHDYGDQPINTIPADCENAEKQIFECQVCGYILEREVGEPLGHDLVEVAEVPATCTETGTLAYFECSRCGQKFVAVDEDYEEVEDEDLVIEALGHNYVGVVTPATCLEEGYTTYTCSRCGDEYVDDITPIDTLNGHDPLITQPAVPATCSASGWTEEVICQREGCGEILKHRTEIPDFDPDNHSALRTVEAQEATCEEGGWDEYVVCDDCGYVEDHNEYDALGHDLEWVDEESQNCTEDGVAGHYECTRCGAKFVGEPTQALEEVTDEDLVLEAYGHDVKETVGTVNPTCLLPGLIVSKCLRCGTFFEDEDPNAPALGHIYNLVEEVPATCTEDGVRAYYYCGRVCTNQITTEEFVCEKLFVLVDEEYVEITEEELVLEALGHDLQDIEAQDPTCTENGWNAYKACSRCDYTEGYEELEATGHTPAEAVQENIEGATCEGIGTYDRVVYCAVCGEELDREEIEDEPLGHDYEWVDEVPATCTEDGVAGHFECTRCGKLFDEDGEEVDEEELAIEKLGHIWGDPVDENVVAPTFDETGSKDVVIYCERCGEELDREVGVEIARLSEYIRFEYELTGINGIEYAVNSGYVYVNVKMIVESDIARLYGVDFALSFDEELTLISVDGHVFEDLKYTKLAMANEYCGVVLAENMGSNFQNKVFERGEYLFTTLIFRVDNDFHNEEIGIEFVYGSNTEARFGLENELVVEYQEDAVIYVATLGDADEIIDLDRDDRITSVDAMILSLLFTENADEEEIPYDERSGIFDMDKNGVIDGEDFVLLHDAIAFNNGYLKLGKYENTAEQE